MTEALRKRLESELAYAADARAHGKEGRARVCARRAAGWAIGAYRRRAYDEPVSARAAIIHLRWLKAEPSLPGELRRAAARLTERVDDDHHLPHPQDPLGDARLIVDAFLHLLAGSATDKDTDR